MLKKRWFEREGNNIKMFSQYDFTDIYKKNYERRMSGDKGYIDQGKDFMYAGTIPLATIAQMTDAEKEELNNDPKAALKFLQKNPLLLGTTARLL